MFELSKALIGDLTLSQLLTHIVGHRAGRLLALDGARAARHHSGGARVGSRRCTSPPRAGQTLSDDDVASVTSGGGPGPLPRAGRATGPPQGVGGPGGEPPTGRDPGPPGRAAGRAGAEPARHVANQAALAVDRAQLRDQALRARLLEEIDRWRRALIGASPICGHPLASIKTAVSSLRQDDDRLGSGDRAELLELIELQSDAWPAC